MKDFRGPILVNLFPSFFCLTCNILLIELVSGVWSQLLFHQPNNYFLYYLMCLFI